MNSELYDLQRCHTEDDRVPIQEWIDSLDISMRARVRIQIDRMEDGNFGDVRPVGEGVSEKKLDFGPGYRIYFGVKGRVVHLPCGGSKGTQGADIAFARKLWRMHG